MILFCSLKNNKHIKELDSERIISVWNSLGCKRHRIITEKVEKALERTYKEYIKSERKTDNEPVDINTWTENYLKFGFGKWMTNFHRDMKDGQWAADLEYAVRFATYEKVKNED